MLAECYTAVSILTCDAGIYKKDHIININDNITIDINTDNDINISADN